MSAPLNPRLAWTCGDGTFRIHPSPVARQLLRQHLVLWDYAVGRVSHNRAVSLLVEWAGLAQAVAEDAVSRTAQHFLPSPTVGAC